jgi:hypothetical protein
MRVHLTIMHTLILHLERGTRREISPQGQDEV